MEQINEILDSSKPLFFKLFDYFLIIFISLFVLSIVNELSKH